MISREVLQQLYYLTVEHKNRIEWLKIQDEKIKRMSVKMKDEVEAEIKEMQPLYIIDEKIKNTESLVENPFIIPSAEQAFIKSSVSKDIWLRKVVCLIYDAIIIACNNGKEACTVNHGCSNLSIQQKNDLNMIIVLLEQDGYYVYCYRDNPQSIEISWKWVYGE